MLLETHQSSAGPIYSTTSCAGNSKAVCALDEFAFNRIECSFPCGQNLIVDIGLPCFCVLLRVRGSLILLFLPSAAL